MGDLLGVVSDEIQKLKRSQLERFGMYRVFGRANLKALARLKGEQKHSIFGNPDLININGAEITYCPTSRNDVPFIQIWSDDSLCFAK